MNKNFIRLSEKTHIDILCVKAKMRAKTLSETVEKLIKLFEEDNNVKTSNDRNTSIVQYKI